MPTIGIQRNIKNILECRLDPYGNILDLSKHFFFFKHFKLLNKNLNFVPTPKQCNQKQLYTDTENFFRLLKLRSHFKDTDTSKIMDTENYIKEDNRQLSHKNNYKTLQIDPTLQHNKIVNDSLDEFKNENVLSQKKTTEGLKLVLLKFTKYTKEIIQGDLPSLTQLIVTPLMFHVLLTITFSH